MYTLRKIISGQEEINIHLGERYTLTTKRDHEETFLNDFSSFFENHPYTDRDECYAFVSSEKGKMEPLWKNQQNFIVTENGKTFSNLSIK